jgi:carboxylesterase
MRAARGRRQATSSVPCPTPRLLHGRALRSQADLISTTAALRATMLDMAVKPGAEPYESTGGDVGVLLCHGFTGSPASMRPWGQHLSESGFAVSAPRLPGHGTTWQEMNDTTWHDWYATVDEALTNLTKQCSSVVVGGLSMGACLALRLAEERPHDVAGLVLVNPAVASENKQLLLIPVLHRFVPSSPGIGNDIKRSGGDEIGYDRTPLRALNSMTQLWKLTRADLPKVTAPLLLFRSAVDHVVDPSSARIILAKVSSRQATETLLHDSFHVATLDNDAPRIFDESVAFTRRISDE